MGTGSFPGVKQPWRGVDHPTPSCAEVEGRVELYLYSPSGPLWSVLGWPLPLHFYIQVIKIYNVCFKHICVSSVTSYRAECIDTLHERLTLTIVGGRAQQNVRANMAGACTLPLKCKVSECARGFKVGGCAAWLVCPPSPLFQSQRGVEMRGWVNKWGT
jgi:hypothetical protein